MSTVERDVDEEAAAMGKALNELDLKDADNLDTVFHEGTIGIQPVVWPMRLAFVRQGNSFSRLEGMRAFSSRGDH